MNYWTEQSIEFARQRNYLDELFRVYPLSPNLRRELTHEQEQALRSAYESRDNVRMINTLLDAELFPIKDSYVPFLRHDRTAITRSHLKDALAPDALAPLHALMSALVLREFLYSL